MRKKYQVISPDGITISPEAPYTSLKKAKQALAEWTKHFLAQGYYSQTCYNGYRRQIPVDCLPDYCAIIEI